MKVQSLKVFLTCNLILYLNSGLKLQFLFIASLSLHAAYSSLQLLQLKILGNHNQLFILKLKQLNLNQDPNTQMWIMKAKVNISL